MDTRIKHESFGVAAFHRVTHGGGRNTLFQSSTDNHITVQLTISRATLNHGLGHDSVFADEELIEVEFTPAQFAELLTTLNMGPGSPCTIRRVQGKSTERINYETETSRIHTAFKTKAKDFGKKLRETKEELCQTIEKAKISQKLQKELLGFLETAICHIESNAPFMVEQFEDAARKVVTQAKSEMDAFVAHAVQSAGLDAIAKGKMPTLQIGPESNS